MDIENKCITKQFEEFEEIQQTCGSFIEWKNNPLPIFQSGKQCKYPLNFTIIVSIDDPIARTPGQFDLECSILKSYPVLAALLDCKVGLKIANEWFPKPSLKNSNSNTTSLCRRWFLSHHIISQVKRHWVMEYARELELTGFLITGTPGYLYIEGDEANQQCFIKRLQSFSWKSMDEVSYEGNLKSRNCVDMIEFEGKPGIIQDTLKQFGLDAEFQKLFGVKK